VKEGGRDDGDRDDSPSQSSGILYVLDADIKKRKPLETIQAILEYHRVRQFREFAFETNQFQDFLANELARESHAQGVRLPLYKIAHTKDKLGRIQSLEPLITGGFLRFPAWSRRAATRSKRFQRGIARPRSKYAFARTAFEPPLHRPQHSRRSITAPGLR
jgi:predicted phage terminase large subunit-like protein